MITSELERLITLEGNDFMEQCDASVVIPLIEELIGIRRAISLSDLGVVEDCLRSACHWKFADMIHEIRKAGSNAD